MTLYRTTLSISTLSTMRLSITTLSIITFSIMTPSITIKNRTLSTMSFVTQYYNDKCHYGSAFMLIVTLSPFIMLSVITLNVVILSVVAPFICPDWGCGMSGNAPVTATLVAEKKVFGEKTKISLVNSTFLFSGE